MEEKVMSEEKIQDAQPTDEKATDEVTNKRPHNWVKNGGRFGQHAPKPKKPKAAKQPAKPQTRGSRFGKKQAKQQGQ